MKVRVRLYGTLSRHADPETPNIKIIDLPSGSRIRDLISELRIEPKEIMVAVVDQRICNPDSKIPEDIEVWLTSVVGGG
jgi:sulfur carrier protein ThiS